MPLVWQTVHDSLFAIDSELLEMATVFRVKKFHVISKIVFRSVFPSLLTTCTGALGFAWKAGVAAEVISSPQMSIGRFLLKAKTSLETTDVFAWTINIVLLSILLESIFKYAVSTAEGDKKAVKYDNA